MADVIPQSIEKSPTADGSVSKPSSGTYGEKADLNRLKQSFPQAQGAAPGGPGGPAPMQAPPGGPLPGGVGRPPNPNMPPGVPGVLGHPTERPNVPQGTRLQQSTGSPIRQASSDRDARIALLMALRDDPSVSEDTREWATIVLRTIDA